MDQLARFREEKMKLTAIETGDENRKSDMIN